MAGFTLIARDHRGHDLALDAPGEGYVHRFATRADMDAYAATVTNGWRSGASFRTRVARLVAYADRYGHDPAPVYNRARTTRRRAAEAAPGEAVGAVTGYVPGRIDTADDATLDHMVARGLAYDRRGIGEYWLTCAGWTLARRHAPNHLGAELHPGVPAYLDPAAA